MLWSSLETSEKQWLEMLYLTLASKNTMIHNLTLCQVYVSNFILKIFIYLLSLYVMCICIHFLNNVVID